MKPFVLFRIAIILFPLSAHAADATAADGKLGITHLYWGDTHLHTSYSPDASLNGNTRIGPEEAFRFARGEAIMGDNGQTARLVRPLDFLVVSDHAEYLGVLPLVHAHDPQVMGNQTIQRWSRMMDSGDKDLAWKAMFEVLHDIQVNKPSFSDQKITASVWAKVCAIADQYNDPGKFTAFIGYEWTSMPGGNNLHRVVVFKNSADKAGQVLPFSSFDSQDPEQLWKWMAHYEETTGGEVLAIPHNGNFSNGQMFQITDFQGRPMTRAYADTRRRWEPLVEVTQIKGDSETHPKLSPEDPYADFERWDRGNLTATALKEDWMFKYEYARSALRIGLQMERKIGVNPFKFGMIGSTDAHTGFSAVDENNFWGHFATLEPGLDRLFKQAVTKGKFGKVYNVWAYEMTASGYAAVWATENTRAALFAAMKRKETYATTGSRMRVRFFAGWDFARKDAGPGDIALEGYKKGVPMGGDLYSNPAGNAPTFLIQAAKDPDGVNLQRIQIVKGWLEDSGETNEAVYDVKVAESGAPVLTAWWQDPEFDPKQRAFYYVRILEVPRPRWTTAEAKRLHVQFNGHVPKEIQDRAYTSPVWYHP